MRTIQQFQRYGMYFEIVKNGEYLEIRPDAVLFHFPELY